MRAKIEEVTVIKADKTKVVEERQIVEYLDDLGFKHSLLGFGYLIDAISGLLTREYKGGMCNLYSSVAAKFGTTQARVERAMRHAIEASECEKICNSEFIHKAADNFRYS